MDFLVIIDNTLNQALGYSFLALSIYISLRLLDFPDLSIEGTFAMGAAIAASIAKYSDLILMSIPIAVIIGFLVGCVTAALNVYLKIGKLLSGILVAIGLYSINFRIMGARANIYLNQEENLFFSLRRLDINTTALIFGNDSPTLLYPVTNLVLFICLVVIVFLLYKFLQSEKGALIRYGRSESKFFFESLGIDYKLYVILGLGIANALAALSGSIIAFQSGSASTSMGFGIILIALVSLVIGERIIQAFHKDLTDLYPVILAPVIGTIAYYLIIKLVRWLNVLWQNYNGYPDPSDQFQFFNSDVRLLSVVLMILIYSFRKSGSNSLNLPERL